MTPTYLWGTGFEMGNIPLPPEDIGQVLDVGQRADGSYWIAMRNSGPRMRFRAVEGLTDAYISLRVYDIGWSTELSAIGNGNNVFIKRQLVDGIWYWNAYVENQKVADGQIGIADNLWYGLEFHVSIGADDGLGNRPILIETRVDGIPDISYNQVAATSGTSSELEYFQYRFASDVDDIAISINDWPGIVRFDRLLPTADVSAEWTPSTVTTANASLVDEHNAYNPSLVDTDYVEADGLGTQVDSYTLPAWDSTGKIGKFISHWSRAKKTDASAVTLTQGLDGGSAVDMPHTDVRETIRYYNQLTEDAGSLSAAVAGTLKAKITG